MAYEKSDPSSYSGDTLVTNQTYFYDDNTSTYAYSSASMGNNAVIIYGGFGTLVKSAKSHRITVYCVLSSASIFDSTYLDYSLNGGSTWTNMESASNETLDYSSTPFTKDITAKVTISDFRIRFRANLHPSLGTGAYFYAHEGYIEREYTEGKEYLYATDYDTSGTITIDYPERAIDGDQTTYADLGAGSSGSDQNSTLIGHTWQSTTKTYSALTLYVKHLPSIRAGQTIEFSYSTDGGSNWTIFHSGDGIVHTDSITLSASQNLANLQVKGYLNVPGGTGNCSGLLYDMYTEGTEAKGAVVGHLLRQLMAGG